MHRLLCNQLLTRRQEMCFILDESEVLVWSGKTTHAAISWLVDNDQPQFFLEGALEEEKFLLEAKIV